MIQFKGILVLSRGNHAEGVYIINPQVRYTLTRDDMHSRIVNEIVRCTMKSSLRSDEIFSLRLQMKLNPPPNPAERDFIAKRFHPPKVDFTRVCGFS